MPGATEQNVSGGGGRARSRRSTCEQNVKWSSPRLTARGEGRSLFRLLPGLLQPLHPSPGLRILQNTSCPSAPWCFHQSDSVELGVAGRERLVWQVLGGRTRCHQSRSPASGTGSEEGASPAPSPSMEMKERANKVGLTCLLLPPPLVQRGPGDVSMGFTPGVDPAGDKMGLAF